VPSDLRKKVGRGARSRGSLHAQGGGAGVVVGMPREGCSRAPRAGDVECGDQKKEGKPKMGAWACSHATVAAAAAAAC
jgi:hypothetical protein